MDQDGVQASYIQAYSARLVGDWNRHQQSRHFYRFKMDGAMAMKTWEMSNDMESVSSLDEIFKYDRQQHQEVLQAKPWQKE